MSLDASRDTRQSSEYGMQLAQAVATTSAVSILSPADNEEIEITAIFVSNYSNQNRYINIFHDDNGTTYDGTTAVVYQDTINASSSPMKFDGFIMPEIVTGKQKLL